MAEDLADTGLAQELADQDPSLVSAQLEVLSLRDRLLGAEAELRTLRVEHERFVAQAAERESGLKDQLQRARSDLDETLRVAAMTSVHLRDAVAENAELLEHLRRVERESRLAHSRLAELEGHAARVQAWSEEIAGHTERVEAWARDVAAHRDQLQAQLDRDAPLARAHEKLTSSRSWRLLRRLRHPFRR
jgi:chromosome segregation ATPase